MKRYLLVCYSRSGKTREVAIQLLDALRDQGGADLEMIDDSVDRHGVLGYLRSALEALLGIAPQLYPNYLQPKDYEAVIIGTPIWFWNIASPVRSYVERHRWALSRVALFCTCGGSGQMKVLNDLEHLCGCPPLARMALTERQMNTRQHLAEIDRFVLTLQNALPPVEAELPRRRRAAG